MSLIKDTTCSNTISGAGVLFVFQMLFVGCILAVASGPGDVSICIVMKGQVVNEAFGLLCRSLDQCAVPGQCSLPRDNSIVHTLP